MRPWLSAVTVKGAGEKSKAFGVVSAEPEPEAEAEAEAAAEAEAPPVLGVGFTLDISVEQKTHLFNLAGFDIPQVGHIFCGPAASASLAA